MATIMTDTTSLNSARKHIETLRAHGARIRVPDSGTMELNSDFYDKAVGECRRCGCNAITYELALPGIDEPMMLAIWRDGHVDSGSVKSVCACLDR